MNRQDGRRVAKMIVALIFLVMVFGLSGMEAVAVRFSQFPLASLYFIMLLLMFGIFSLVNVVFYQCLLWSMRGSASGAVLHTDDTKKVGWNLVTGQCNEFTCLWDILMLHGFRRRWH